MSSRRSRSISRSRSPRRRSRSRSRDRDERRSYHRDYERDDRDRRNSRGRDEGRRKRERSRSPRHAIKSRSRSRSRDRKRARKSPSPSLSSSPPRLSPHHLSTSKSNERVIEGEVFDWKLKREKEAKEGKHKSRLTAEEEARRQQEVLKEVERLKRQREERLREQAAARDQREMIDREKELEMNDILSKKEDEFHLNQAKFRATKRISENRGKPVDFLYVTSNPNVGLPYDTVIPLPAKIFRNMTEADIKEIKEDLRLFLDLDPNKTFWTAVEELVRHRSDEIQNKTVDDGAVAAVVADEIEEILKGKTHKELVELEKEINATLNSGAAVDEEYWASLLKRLQIRKAEAIVDETHSLTVAARLKELSDMGADQSQIDELYAAMRSDSQNQSSGKDEESKSRGKIQSVRSAIEQAELEDVNLGHVPLWLRESTYATKKTRQLTDREMYNREKERGIAQDEEAFTHEIELPHFEEQKKAGLRKPLYYNRVKSGFEWNQYNRAHYDADNPPPKVVFGYQFNLFYADLEDPTKTPTYKIHKTEDQDLVILEFIAGPPYRNIAFKIRQGEWEKLPRAGFKSVFTGGMMQLHFNFKRYRYKR